MRRSSKLPLTARWENKLIMVKINKDPKTGAIRLGDTLNWFKEVFMALKSDYHFSVARTDYVGGKVAFMTNPNA